MKTTIACLLALAATGICFTCTASAQSAGAVAKSSKTCTGDRGRPAKADATWCRGGELHACNGKNGQWVNTRQKCNRSDS